MTTGKRRPSRSAGPEMRPHRALSRYDATDPFRNESVLPEADIGDIYGGPDDHPSGAVLARYRATKKTHGD